jgi:GTP cyclohydrolase IB
MTVMLPDISLTDKSSAQSSLQWVGMEDIDLPVRLGESDYTLTLHARVDAQVNLPAVDIKGIHMSRLYRLVDDQLGGKPITPRLIQEVLLAMIDSHQDCQTTEARLRIKFQMLVLRPALVTPELNGWKSYPVELEGQIQNGQFSVSAKVRVTYSSTCPCSAALARKVIEDAFVDKFQAVDHLTLSDVAAWLKQNATLATPHSQRSLADVTIALRPDETDLSLIRLIDYIEKAVGTPVQTAVKRADELAFAELNGQNLMFVEDAARRIKETLLPLYGSLGVKVCHLESLHPHDAVAYDGVY